MEEPSPVMQDPTAVAQQPCPVTADTVPPAITAGSGARSRAGGWAGQPHRAPGAVAVHAVT